MHFNNVRYVYSVFTQEKINVFFFCILCYNIKSKKAQVQVLRDFIEKNYGGIRNEVFF